MQIATFDVEKKYQMQKYSTICGVDEVGRGPLAGPVVSAACAIKNHVDYNQDPLKKQWKMIRDSKCLSEKQRQETFAFIKEHFYVGIGQCDVETIDRINILQATFVSMRKAFCALEQNIENIYANYDCENTIILVDGRHAIPQIVRKQSCVIKGDCFVKSIAAASIVAKVTRDWLIEEYDNKYPQYGFSKHKGYGTKMHCCALKKYGVTPVHRKSFKPVKALL